MAIIITSINNFIFKSHDDKEYELQRKISSLQDDLDHAQDGMRESSAREERDSVQLVKAQREARTLSARAAALQHQVTEIQDKLEIEKKRKEDLLSQLGNASLSLR